VPECFQDVVDLCLLPELFVRLVGGRRERSNETKNTHSASAPEVR